MNIFWELLEAVIKCMIIFQGLNFDAVKEILKIRSHIYILMKKVIILRKNMWQWSLSPHHRKKLNIFTPQLLIYYIQYSNRKSRLVQMPKQPLEVFCEKRYFLKCRKIHRKLLCQRKHLWILQNFNKYLFYRTTPEDCLWNADIAITKQELWVVFVVENWMQCFIPSAKIPEREGSISPSSFYGHLPDY